MKATLASPSLSKTEISEILNAWPEGEEIYSNDNQRLVKFQAAGLDLVAKVYRIKGFKDRLTAALRYSRARRSYRAAQWLIGKGGISTPKPQLLIENNPLTSSQSILITDFCEADSLLSFLVDDRPLPSDIALQIHRLLSQLRDASCAHRDFHARNLLVSKSGILSLIDLDGARFLIRESAIIRNNLKDRDRLLKSLQPHPDFYKTLTSVIGGPGEAFPRPSSNPSPNSAE